LPFWSKKRKQNTRLNDYDAPRDVYIEPTRRDIPSWLLPLIIFLLIVLIVFYLAPRITTSVIQLFKPAAATGDAVLDDLYGEETLVVTESVANLLADDDLKSSRVAQALYNEPVTQLKEQTNFGFTAVRLRDGTTGYMFSDQLTDYRGSVEPAGHSYRLVITAASRRVMSHASRGTLVAEVMMGTELFADYRGNGIYRVHLPGGGKGWISDEGTVALGIHEKLKPPADLERYFVSSAMAFHKVTRLENGLSIRGASSTGIAYIAGLVNGVDLPRSLASLYTTGTPMPFSRDAETGLLSTSDLHTGDLVFMAATVNGSEAQEMGIVMEDGQLLMTRRGSTSVRLINLDQEPELNRLIIGIRRVLPQR
jgi:hypothetical protein